MTTQQPTVADVRALESFLVSSGESQMLLTFQGILRSHEDYRAQAMAASTPPADDVREALARLSEWRGWFANGEAPSPSEWAEFDRHLAAVDTQPTTCRICKHGGDAHSRRFVSKRRGFETVRACADCACVDFVQEVRPLGTVTDAAVEAAMRAHWDTGDHVVCSVGMRAALEAAWEVQP